MMTDNPSIIGTLQLDDDHRLIAYKYSAEQYSAKYLGDGTWKPQRSFPNYHHFDRPTPVGSASARQEFLKDRGTMEDRNRFIQELRQCAIELPDEERDSIRNYVSKGTSFNSLSSDQAKEVAYGYEYDTGWLSNENPKAPFFFGRGPYYAGAHSFEGITTGRASGDNISTPARPVIDDALKTNLGKTQYPTEKFYTGQQGVLTLNSPTMQIPEGEGPSVNWILPYNDTYYLGAVHFQNPVFVASRLSDEEIWRRDDSIAMTIFGRENALIRGSEAYELHRSKDLGDTYVYVGAPKGGKYGVEEALKAIRFHTEKESYRRSLTWMSNETDNIQPGEVIVQELQKLVDGKWIGMRDANALSEDEYSTDD